jgi:TetR/AcrR family transcriptional regulator, transcriptional repressor for nem operon
VTKPPSAQRRGPGSRADHGHPTRHDLLDAAIVVAERGGLGALSVTDVTAEAGLAKGTFYVHFPDRAAIVVAMHERFHDALFTRIGAATEALPAGAARASARLDAFLEGCRKQPGVRSMLLDARSDPTIRALMIQRNAEASELLRADLQTMSHIKHPADTSRLIVAATAEVATAELMAGRRLANLREALHDLLGGASAR